jgi:hypothetical protein
MAYTTINKPSEYFNTKLYTGTGSSNSVTGVGFQPDFTWIKVRSEANNHELYDAVRGATKKALLHLLFQLLTQHQDLVLLNILVDGASCNCWTRIRSNTKLVNTKHVNQVDAWWLA